MRTHYAIIRSSQRPVPVERAGPIMYVLHRQTGPYPSVSGPYRTDDRRFVLMPRDWRPFA